MTWLKCVTDWVVWYAWREVEHAPRGLTVACATTTNETKHPLWGLSSPWTLLSSSLGDIIAITNTGTRFGRSIFLFFSPLLGIFFALLLSISLMNYWVLLSTRYTNSSASCSELIPMVLSCFPLSHSLYLDPFSHEVWHIFLLNDVPYQANAYFYSLASSLYSQNSKTRPTSLHSFIVIIQAMVKGW